MLYINTITTDPTPHTVQTCWSGIGTSKEKRGMGVGNQRKELTEVCHQGEHLGLGQDCANVKNCVTWTQPFLGRP